MAQPRRRALGLLALLVAHREAGMTLGTLAAIRAIVAVHAQYPGRLLAAIDEDIEHERARRPGATQFGEEDSMIGPVQIKTGPAGKPDPHHNAKA